MDISKNVAGRHISGGYFKKRGRQTDRHRHTGRRTTGAIELLAAAKTIFAFNETGHVESIYEYARVYKTDVVCAGNTRTWTS